MYTDGEGNLFSDPMEHLDDTIFGEGKADILDGLN